MEEAGGKTSALVEICGVSKRFGDIELLSEVDLAVAAGEKIAIIGPSGSRKTTLLRCVAHLERPSAGYVAIAGQRVGQSLVRGQWREMKTANSRTCAPASAWCSSASTCSRIRPRLTTSCSGQCRC